MANYLSKNWTKRNTLVFKGKWLASDPSIIKEGSTYHMYYTDIAFDWPDGVIRTVISYATSLNAITWTVKGEAIRGIYGTPRNSVEAACIFKTGATYRLLYSAYETGRQLPSDLYEASGPSPNGPWVGIGPIIQRTVNGFDHDGIFSPTVIPYAGGWLMLYVAHSYTGINPQGVSIMAAVSADGVTWTKDGVGMLHYPVVSYCRDGVAEPCLLPAPIDGWYYMMISGLNDSISTKIGMARSRDPRRGPWEIRSTPIISPDGSGFDSGFVIAPHFTLENGLAKAWFVGVTTGDVWSVGYAESNWA